MAQDVAADRDAIRELIARYNQTGDADDVDGYVGCFAEDARFEAPGFHHDGRAAIRAWKESHSIFGKTSFRMHVTGSTSISFESADSARARSNWIAVTDAGPDHAGRYHDHIVRTAGGWRFVHRQVDILWQAGASQIGREHAGTVSESR